MARIETKSASAKALKGLHLFHVSRSNCASRVRLLIEEKELPWVSHYVDIFKRENISEEYFAINPKGLVPSLVHDGQVVVESNDIMMYLEERFPAPSFSPTSASDVAKMTRWLKRSGEIHVPGVKTFAYAKRNAALIVKTEEEVARYRALQTDPELLSFHAKHDLPGNVIPENEVKDAAALLNNTMGEINAVLGREGWLVGSAYSLADMSWATTITTLRRATFPLAEFTHITEWHARISERPGWKRALPMWDDLPPERVMAMSAGVGRQA